MPPESGDDGTARIEWRLMRAWRAISIGILAGAAQSVALAEGAPTCEVRIRVVDGKESGVANWNTLLEVEVVNRGSKELGLGDWLASSFQPQMWGGGTELPRDDLSSCPRIYVELDEAGWKTAWDSHHVGLSILPGVLLLQPGEGAVAQVPIGECLSFLGVSGRGKLWAWAKFNDVRSSALEILADLGSDPQPLQALKLDDGTEPPRRFHLRLRDQIWRLVRAYAFPATLILLSAAAMLWISLRHRSETRRPERFQPEKSGGSPSASPR